MSGQPTHGLSCTTEYRAWQTMRLRCTEPTNAAWPNYGGRGISVCDRWLNDVAAFIADMGPRPSPKHELDRRDNNGNYEPRNCRWVLRKVNDRNRRSNRLLTFKDETVSLAEWCERLQLPRDTVRKRLEAGWTVDDALSVPVQAKLPNGQRRTYTQPCVECGASTSGNRCQPCENRKRPRDASTGRVLCSVEQREVEAA